MGLSRPQRVIRLDLPWPSGTTNSIGLSMALLASRLLLFSLISTALIRYLLRALAGGSLVATPSCSRHNAPCA